MKIEVIRDYSGEEGEGPNKDVIAGRTIDVSETRGNQLIANGLGKKASGKASGAHLALITDEQPVASVQSFPSGGVTSVAPVNQFELDDGTRVLTDDTNGPGTPVTGLTSNDQENVVATSEAGLKAAVVPENKKAREPANKVAPRVPAKS